MKRAAEGLEPAEVNPKQLIQTAILLILAMILSGFVIFYSYLNHVSKQKYRPAIIDELIGQMRFRLADGQVVNTAQVDPDVWLLMQSTLADREGHTERAKALAAVPQEGIQKLIFYVDVDPNQAEEMARMADLPKEEGTWHIAAKAEVVNRWLKNEVKFGRMPTFQNGQWIYDTSVIVVKRDWTSPEKPRMHVRGERFDFDLAKKQADEAGKPELADGYRDDWFVKAVNYLLQEEDPTKSDS